MYILISKINKYDVVDTNYVLGSDDELLCYYINNGFVKLACGNEYYGYEIKFDKDYYLNANLDEYIVDEFSFRAINKLRYVIYKYEGILNEKDKEYLESLNYDFEYEYEVPTELKELYLFYLWQLLLCTHKQLGMLGFNPTQRQSMQRRLQRKGYHLKPKEGITNYQEYSNNIAQIENSDVVLDKGELENKIEETRKKLLELKVQLAKVERGVK